MIELSLPDCSGTNTMQLVNYAGVIQYKEDRKDERIQQPITRHH